ncbi:unnamed protein product [Prunus brigantina]
MDWEDQAITSAMYQKIRYPFLRGSVGQIDNNQAMVRRCLAKGLKNSKQAQFILVSQTEQVSPKEEWKPEEDVDLVPLVPHKPERKVRIGLRLSLEEKVKLTTFLQNNKDVFVWSPFDMPSIDLQIIRHCLHVNPASKPVA